MLVSKIKEENLTIDLIDKLLFQDLDDTGETADCIIVLGSMKAATYRVPVAVAAYQAGRADNYPREFIPEHGGKYPLYVDRTTACLLVE